MFETFTSENQRNHNKQTNQIKAKNLKKTMAYMLLCGKLSWNYTVQTFDQIVFVYFFFVILINENSNSVFDV